MRKIYRGKDVEEQWESNQKKPEDKNKCIRLPTHDIAFSLSILFGKSVHISK